MSNNVIRKALILCFVSCLAMGALTAAPPAQAQLQGQPAALPTDAQLDALLAARDWNRLGAALNASNSAPWVKHRMDWLETRIGAGGGSLLDFLYIRDLWGIGSALNVADPNQDLRTTAGLIWLYTYEIITIDGATCEDRSAPGHRIDQLVAQNPQGKVFAYLKTLSPDWKVKLVDIATALEKKTAPRRKEDDLICRGGLEEMQAGIAAGKTHPVPTPPGMIGKTIDVAPPPGYAPKYLPPETYLREQVKARSEMKAGLLKLLG